jgi:E3 ubiquitin-protein ligase HUWE1
LLINGCPVIDLEDLRKNTRFSGFSANDKHIEWFWRAVEELDEEGRAKLLQFVTDSSKVPLGGFAELSNQFHISKAR